MRRAAALLCAGLVACGGGEPAPRARNALLISIDTLRADHLSCYGYGRETSPGLDRLAASGVRFESVLAPTCWTIPSHLTMLSGLYPQSHGVIDPEKLPGPDVRLLAEELQAAGFYTFAFTDGGYMSKRWGFARGFDSFHGEGESIFDENRRGLTRTLEDARNYLRFRRDKGRFFGFLHTYEVHCPYDPPEPYRAMFATQGRQRFKADGGCGATMFNTMEMTPEKAVYLADRYDGGIRWVDDRLGDFLEWLEAEGFLEDTAVIVTSDHGEEFLEHGRIGHEQTLHAEVLAVPLIVRAPGVAPRVVHEPVGLVDLTPTVLELLGVPAPTGTLDGRSLLPLLRGQPLDLPAFRPAQLDWLAELDAWVGPDARLIVDRATGAAQLYDPRSDPGEQDDLAPREPERVAHLRAELQAFLAGLEARAVSRREALGADEREALRALGYVDVEEGD